MSACGTHSTAAGQGTVGLSSTREIGGRVAAGVSETHSDAFDVFTHSAGAAGGCVAACGSLKQAGGGAHEAEWGYAGAAGLLSRGEAGAGCEFVGTLSGETREELKRQIC